MSEVHVEAIVARLEDGPAGPLNAHDADPSSTTYPYVVVYADAGIASSDREADRRVTVNLGWQTTTVGESAGQCRAALDRVNAALEDWLPDVLGWTCDGVTHESSQPVRPDEKLPDRSLFIATDQWRAVFDPA